MFLTQLDTDCCPWFEATGLPLFRTVNSWASAGVPLLDFSSSVVGASSSVIWRCSVGKLGLYSLES